MLEMKAFHKWAIGLGLMMVASAVLAVDRLAGARSAWWRQADRDAVALVSPGQVPDLDTPLPDDLHSFLFNRLDAQVRQAAESSLRAVNRSRRRSELRSRIRKDIDDKRQQQRRPPVAGLDGDSENSEASGVAALDRSRRPEGGSGDSVAAGTPSRLREEIRPQISASAQSGDSSNASRVSGGPQLHDDAVSITDRQPRPTPVRPGRTVIQPSPNDSDTADAIGADKPDQTVIRTQPDGSDRTIFTMPGDIRAPGRRTR